VWVFFSSSFLFTSLPQNFFTHTCFTDRTVSQDYCVGQPSAVVVGDVVYLYYSNIRAGDPGVNMGYVRVHVVTSALRFKQDIVPLFVRSAGLRWGLGKRAYATRIALYFPLADPQIFLSASGNGIDFGPVSSAPLYEQVHSRTLCDSILTCDSIVLAD
jgi:hypothetical protein